MLIWIRRSVFSYQVFMVVQPRPTLHYLLKEAHEKSAVRAAAAAGEPGA
jgi:hypothetical protein